MLFRWVYMRPTVYPPGLSLASLTAIFFPVEFQAFVKIKQTSEHCVLAVCVIECTYVHHVHDCMRVCMCTVSMEELAGGRRGIGSPETGVTGGGGEPPRGSWEPNLGFHKSSTALYLLLRCAFSTPGHASLASQAFLQEDAQKLSYLRPGIQS